MGDLLFYFNNIFTDIVEYLNVFFYNIHLCLNLITASKVKSYSYSETTFALIVSSSHAHKY
jgi:hypothetical protein